MNPVARTLQTIAAIQGETRERHVDAASTYSTEPVHSQSLSASSPSIGRDMRTAPSAKSRSDCGLEQSVEAPPTAQAKTSAPEAALAREIRIDKRDRVIAAPARDITRHPMIIITGALLLPLVLYFGWIEGFNSDFFTIKPASLPVEKRAADLPDAAKSDRLAVQGSSANTTIGSAHESSKRGVQITDPLLTKQGKRGPQAAAVEPTKVPPKPAPVPETGPTTIEGWTLLEVKGGTAVLEGPNGTWRATRGDTVPGVGKIDSIVRWGSRWIVATSKGLISTR
jgi:hypothetical protein